MNLSQLIFPCVFLPVVYVVFQLVPNTFKKLVLLLSSLVFFAWGSVWGLVVACLSCVANYACAKLISAENSGGDGARAKRVVTIAVAGNILLLALFKYLTPVFESVTVRVAAPVGLSYFTFAQLSFLFDIYRKKVELVPDAGDYALYVFLFPKAISGPIAQYADMQKQLDSLTLSHGRTETGMRMFMLGLSKKLLLADTLALVFGRITELDAPGLATAWLGAVCYSFVLYYDFGGYSDMAKGLGYMFGFTLPDNFVYPYTSKSVAEFWRRWHASLGAWFRDYVYIPLGGSREGKSKTIRNLAVVWLLTGIWHGASLTFVLWGVWHGAIIILEKFVLKGFLDRLPKVLRQVLTYVTVVVGWVFFFSDSVSGAFRYLGTMLGSNGAVDASMLYELKSAALLLVVCGIGATPLVKKAAVKFRQKGGAAVNAATVAVFALLALLCIAAMIGSTYTSFLYGNF